MIVLPPSKDNIKYCVSRFASMEENFGILAEQLKQKRTDLPRTIIYCRSMDDCATIYLYFQNYLKHNFTEPPGAPSLSKYRLVELFTSCTDNAVKNQIIASFTQHSCLRVVCATVAFVLVADIIKLKKVGALLCKSSKIILHLNCFRSSDDLLCKTDSKLHISLISFLMVDPTLFII